MSFLRFAILFNFFTSSNERERGFSTKICLAFSKANRAILKCVEVGEAIITMSNSEFLIASI